MSLMPSRKRVLAVDWDARSLRVVHAEMRKSGVRVLKMLSVDVPAAVDIADPEQVGGLIREVLSAQRIRTDRIILDVPRDQALLTNLQLPAASPDEMPALVEFQITKELPFALSEAVVDFTMPEDAGGQPRIDVLVGTVRREVVGYYEKVCAAAGLKLERLGLRPYANKVALNDLLGKARYACAVMVDVGPKLTEIDIIADGRLAFSRAGSVAVGLPREGDAALESEAEDESSIIQFPRASAEGDAVEQAVNALLVEVTRSIEAYRAQAGGVEVGIIVVGGSVGVEARLAEALGKRFSASVELYNPARQFGWPEERGREARAFAAALGLVGGHAGEGRLHFDFLHPKKVVTATERRLRKAPAVAAAVALFVVAGTAFYFQSIAPQQTELARLETEIDETKDEIEELTEFREKVVSQIDAFESEQIIWLDELEWLRELMPDNSQMVCNSMYLYQKGGRISLPVQCKSMAVANDTISRIKSFTLPGKDTPHFNATSGSFTERGRDMYPASGSIDVFVLENPGA